MHDPQSATWRKRFAGAASLAALLLCGGCVGTLANLMHAAQGNLVPARYAGLKGKRVAVVCVSDSQAFGPTAASIELQRRVTRLLSENVTEIQMVEAQEIADWIDRNDWDYVDYKEVGRGVDADMVVAIDLASFSLNEGLTLYKGRADVRVAVYDLENGGKEVFVHNPTQIQFPQNSGHSTTEMSAEAFRRKFLSVLSGKVARQFYSYDVKEDFARDATLIHGE